MSIARYDLTEDCTTGKVDITPVPETMEGRYVSYEDYAALEARCAALAAESSGMSAFVDALLCIAWQGGSADGAEIQELALKHGLLRQEIYSADKHENQVDDPGNFEDGDPVYFRVETPATDSFLAEVRAQGVEMYAEHLTRKADASGENKNHAYAYLAANFAAQLRKGVQS